MCKLVTGLLTKMCQLISGRVNVFVYTKYKNNFLETMWTDRKSKTRRTKKLKKIETD